MYIYTYALIATLSQNLIVNAEKELEHHFKLPCIKHLSVPSVEFHLYLGVESPRSSHQQEQSTSFYLSPSTSCDQQLPQMTSHFYLICCRVVIVCVCVCVRVCVCERNLPILDSLFRHTQPLRKLLRIRM